MPDPAPSVPTPSATAPSAAVPSPAGAAAVAVAPSTTAVRYFAAAKAAFGRAEERVDPADCADLAALIARAPASARAMLERCSFLVDGVATTDLATRLPPGGLVDVLPPFAGG